MTEEMVIGFYLGFVVCMIADVLFSIKNFFLQRAFKERAIRRAVDKKDEECLKRFAKRQRLNFFKKPSEDQDDVR